MGIIQIIAFLVALLLGGCSPYPPCTVNMAGNYGCYIGDNVFGYGPAGMEPYYGGPNGASPVTVLPYPQSIPYPVRVVR